MSLTTGPSLGINHSTKHCVGCGPPLLFTQHYPLCSSNAWTNERKDLRTGSIFNTGLYGMSADFIAGYVSGAVSIIVGNPLDLIKTRIQAGSTVNSGRSTERLPWTKQFDKLSALVRGAAAPVLGYGALNAILFTAYNRSLALLSTGDINIMPERASPANIWAAGALGGLASFIVSAPTELVKCRAQVSSPPESSWQVTKDIFKTRGLRGLYLGGGVTSLRDSIGYGFYFWSYELCKSQMVSPDDEDRSHALKILLCGGIAGVVTWASVFPLDVIKTRLQTFDLQPRPGQLSDPPRSPEQRPLLSQTARSAVAGRPPVAPSALHIARELYRTEGPAVFFRGLGICSGRAFIVNAVQWAIYEWTMALLKPDAPKP